jgi:hypothetical protein
MMKSSDAVPPYETKEIGTPKDYTSDAYRCYFEVGEHENRALEIFHAYLGPKKSKSLISLTHGFEVELAIQCVPDLVRELVSADVGVYQVIRIAKTDREWE